MLLRNARHFSHLLPQSEEVLMAAQSVARILDAHESSPHLSTLNQALSSILQVATVQTIDRVSLCDQRCRDLVNKVIGRMNEMNAEEFVHMAEWLSKSRIHKVGWRELTYPERDSFHRRLRLHADSQALSPSQILSIVSSCSAMGISFRPVTGALEKKLTSPEVQLHATDIQKLLEVLAKTSKVSGRLLALVLRKLHSIDTSLMDPKAQVSVYNSLCSLEVSLQSDHVITYLENFIWEMVKRAKSFGEAELVEWTDVHARLKYPRLEVSKALLSEISRRLDKADVLSKTFGYSILKPLTIIKAYHQMALPAASLSKLLVEVAKNLPSQFVYASDFEATVRMAMQLTDSFPLVFTLAVKRKAQSFTRESFWLPTVIRYCELAGEDSSFTHSFLPSVAHDVSTFPVTDRLTMLNGVYLLENSNSLEGLEQMVISSLASILNERELHRSLNLLQRVLMHPNKQLIKKVDFVRKETLEQLFMPWPQNVPKHWVMFLSYFTYKGNQELWERLFHQVKFTPTEYVHSISLLTAEDRCLEPALSALERVASSASPDNVFFTHKLFNDQTDIKLVERYLKIMDKVDIKAASSAVVVRSIDFLLRYVTDKNMFSLLPNYLPALQAVHWQPLPDMDEFTKGKLLKLLVTSGSLKGADALPFVKEHINEKSTAIIAASLAALMLPEIKEAGLVQDFLRVLNDRRLNETIVVTKAKCAIIAELPKDFPTESAGKLLIKRTALLGGHLCPLLIDLVASLPCRLLSEQEEFIQNFTLTLLKRNNGEFLNARTLVRLLKVLSVQRLSVGWWRNLVNRVMEKYKTLDVGAKVSLLEVAARWGEGFNDVTFRLCQDISASPLDYLHNTGRILGALSDGNLQHTLPSAQVAEALVFSPQQTFAMSEDAIAQILMFCVRIGMEDTQIIRKILALPPPLVPGKFNLKRYLLHLYYKDKENAHFSLKSELEGFKSAIKSTAWMHFHSEQDLKALTDAQPNLTTKTFCNDLYLPALDEVKKKVLWPVPLLAVQLPGQKQLLGDYRFYLDVCKKVAELDAEPLYREDISNRL